MRNEKRLPKYMSYTFYISSRVYMHARWYLISYNNYDKCLLGKFTTYRRQIFKVMYIKCDIFIELFNFI